jgi:hypothetical protein
MPDHADDFWPTNFPTVAGPSAPVGLLREQAIILAGKTGRRVEGVVRESTVEGTVYYSLYLKAPALGDYMFKVLHIAHPVTQGPLNPFPLTVEDSFTGVPITVSNMEEFKSWLKSVLASEKVGTVIANLIRHSEPQIVL